MLQEESYILKKHGNYSLIEQNNMTGEERTWAIKRLEQDSKKQQEEMEKGKGGHTPHMPHVSKGSKPSMPSMPRPRR